MQITERDRELLQKLSDYRLLSAEQIRHLLFPSLNRARKRMVQLFRHGLVTRFTRPVRLGEGSSQFLYRPSRKGTAQLTGPSPASPRRPRGFTESHGEHALRINDFRICMELASRLSDDLERTFWRADRDVKIVIPVTKANRVVRVPVVPDGFFGLQIQGRDLCYMLEVDRGTTPLPRVKIKLEAYLNLWQSRPLLAQLKIPTIRLLWITSGQQRLQNLLKVVQSLTREYPRTDILFLTTQDQVTLAQPQAILGRVWHMVAKSQVQSASPFPAIPFERSRPYQVNHQCADQRQDAGSLTNGPGG